MTVPTATSLVLVDSSGWLEYITADTKAELFEPYFKNLSQLIVPSLVIYEVRKVLMLNGATVVADWFISEVERHKIVPIDQGIAQDAALVSINHKLHMADALIYTTAIRYRAQLVTSDPHFRHLSDVSIL